MKKSVTITFFNNCGTKLCIHYLDISKKVPMYNFNYDIVLQVILLVYVLKTCFSCVPKIRYFGIKT